MQLTCRFARYLITCITFLCFYGVSPLAASEPFVAGEWVLAENGIWVRNPDAGVFLPSFIIVKLSGSDDSRLVEVRDNLSFDDMKLPRPILTELGIRVPGFSFGWVPLNQIKGLQYYYDFETETLELRPSPEARLSQAISPIRRQRNPGGAKSDFALGVNYRIWGNFTEKPESSGLKFRNAILGTKSYLSTPFGVLTANHTITYQPDRLGSNYSISRGDLVFSVPFQSRRLSLNIGDIRTRSLLGRSVYLGGIQLNRNFALDPSFAPEQRFSYKGSVSEPSTVDVIIDGILQFSGEIDAGPFSVTDLPFVTGDGDAHIVVRDLEGRERTIKIPVNNQSSTLKPGALDFSIEAGYGREITYGQNPSYNRDSLLFSATARYGLAEQWTLGAGIEGGRDFGSATLSSSISWPGNLALTVGVGLSKYKDLTGNLFALRLNTQWDRVNISLSSVRRSAGYRDLASIAGSDISLPPLEEDFLTVSAPFGKQNVSLSLSNRKSVSSRNTIIGVNYFTQFSKSRTSLSASVFHDLRSGNTSAQLSLRIPLGRRLGTAGLRTSRRRNGDIVSTVSLSRALGTKTGDYGLRISHDVGGAANDALRLNVSLRTGFGIARADYSRNNTLSGQTLSIGFEGAFAISPRGLAFSGPIRGGFTLVNARLRGIPLSLNGRKVAKTNFLGAALIPTLRPYYSNRISINRQDLPEGYIAQRTGARVVPHAGAGINLRFVVKPITAATYIIVDAMGKTLPSETLITLNAVSRPGLWIGHSGQTFLDILKPNNVLIAEYNGKKCRSEFSYPPKQQQNAAFQILSCK